MLVPYTIQELDQMLDEAEKQFAAGDYLSNEECNRLMAEHIASLQKNGLDQALDEAKQGGVYHAESVDDMFS